MPLKQESPSSPLARGKLSIPSLQVAFFKNPFFPSIKNEGKGRVGEGWELLSIARWCSVKRFLNFPKCPRKMTSDGVLFSLQLYPKRSPSHVSLMLFAEPLETDILQNTCESFKK